MTADILARWSVATFNPEITSGETIARELGLGVSAFRHFALFDTLAAKLPSERADALGAASGVLHVVEPRDIPGSQGGFWYVNLLAAWEEALRRAERYDGCVINMSLGPPPEPSNVFHADEPMNRATRRAADLGAVVVISAGNNGEAGNDTLTRWARAPWVIAVGAADESTRRVEPYSSRGVPGGESPFVVAPGERYIGGAGSSFAAQHVTDIAYALMHFALDVLSSESLLDRAQMRQALAGFVRSALREMAAPVSQPPHVGGAGFVSLPRALEFIRTSSSQKLLRLMGSPAADAKTVRHHQKHAELELLERKGVGRVVIDTDYHWTIPTYVYGVLNWDGVAALPRATEITRGDDFYAAAFPEPDSTSTYIAIRPPKGRRLIVGRGEFDNISAAIEAANDWDTIHVPPGEYREHLSLKASVNLEAEIGATLIGEGSTPLKFDNVNTITIAGLNVRSEGSEAALLFSSRNVAFRNCTFTSTTGNGVSAFASSRLEFVNCSIEGAGNGAFLVHCRGVRMQGVKAVGAKSGLLLYAASGRLLDCAITGRQAFGIMYIASPTPWTNKAQRVLQVEGCAAVLLEAGDISPREVAREDVVGEVSRYFHALVLEDSVIAGEIVAIAALERETILRQNCMLHEGLARLVTSAHVPVSITDTTWANNIAAINNSLKEVHLVPF